LCAANAGGDSREPPWLYRCPRFCATDLIAAMQIFSSHFVPRLRVDEIHFPANLNWLFNKRQRSFPRFKVALFVL
jgi:hypothetical protein